MLIVNKEYESLNRILEKDTTDIQDNEEEYNWYSIRSKNMKGSIIIEFKLTVKDNASSDESLFIEDVRSSINNSIENGTAFDGSDSNTDGNHNYDEFERNALNYVNGLNYGIENPSHLGVFKREGGNNGKVSDLKLRYDPNFWVECKMNPEARGGQFTVRAIDKKEVVINTVPTDNVSIGIEGKDKDDFDNMLNGFIDITKNKLNSIFNSESCNKDSMNFFNYMSTHELIDLSDGLKGNDAESYAKGCIAYVKAHYAHKDTKYFITGKSNTEDGGTQFIIVPLKNLEDVFEIKAFCRFKRYNAKVVPKKYSKEVMDTIYAALLNNKDNKEYDFKRSDKWYKRYRAIRVKSDRASFEIPGVAIDGVNGPITLVFDKKDKNLIKDTKL